MKTWRKLLTLALAAMMIASCLPVVAETAATYGEAPMLAEQVAAGTLPKVEDRLPVAGDIAVEPVTNEIGQYGGTLSITTGDSARWTWGPYTEQSMFRFKQDGSGEVEANLCKAFYANEDYTVWTVEMREGMKWSDGEPFTADDVIFYYDHMSTPALNEDRTPVPVDAEGYYSAFTSKPYNCYQVKIDGVVHWAKFEKVDDYKFTVTFAAPKQSFPVDCAVDNKWGVLPKHFYVNYVARKDGVTDDPTFPLITEEEAIANANRDFGKEWDNYSNLGKSIGYYNWDYAIVPQLRSFIAVKDNWNKAGEVYELVRNPYFFKTDAAGNQLPYLDSIKVYIINENEQQVLKASAGEIDFYSTEAGSFATVATATKDTHYVLKEPVVSWSYNGGFLLNQTVKDDDKRALFQNVEFRHALSIAADRDLLSATLTNGQAEPAQSSVPKGAFGYDEEWFYKWTDYDPDTANTILDTLTEPWDRAAGTFRKMKGTDKELEIIFSIKDINAPEGDFFALLKSAFAAVGVKLSEKVDTELAKTILANDHEACFEGITCSSPVIRPDEIVPMRNYRAWYGAYGKWYEDARSTANGGIEPPADVMELINAYEAIQSASGENRDAIISENILKIYNLHKENTWIIGYLADLPVRVLVNNKLGNIPETVVYADEFRYQGNVHFEQVYWKN